MKCLVIGDQGVAVCGGGGITIRAVRRCPTCKQRRRFTGSDEAWYGLTVTCCACGDSWQSGELMARPRSRGWRKESAAKARKVWPVAVRVGSPEHRQYIREEIGFEQPEEASDGDA